ncbi:sulfite exporter TauE/SafE family protein [Rhizobium sp. KVB221]|uniref:Probable membrane transporter protein n=1 Tax=Rhizobium setariae TaxID=2801340 RepID=A0A936YTB5_9HYPH|nr:sulfite exporter TauE/SafE family protein [Rhizobium setariae]MBL0374522.1 sulfite exporter TauE/SafE family protein [Rhizobium setariae]
MPDITSLTSAVEAALPTQSIGLLFALLLTLFVAGLARGFSGFGAALIFIPIGSALAGPGVASPLLLIIDTVAAATLLPNAAAKADKKDVTAMSFGALLTVPLGAAALVYVDPVSVRWAISITAIFFLCFLISGWRFRGPPSAFAAVLVGATAGLFSGAAQLGGPPVVAYWLGGRANIATVRANIVLYFAVSSLFTIVSYVIAQLITAQVLLLALVSAPFYAAGLYLGAKSFGLASERTFRMASYTLIGIAAVASLPLADHLLR